MKVFLPIISLIIVAIVTYIAGKKPGTMTYKICLWVPVFGFMRPNNEIKMVLDQKIAPWYGFYQMICIVVSLIIVYSI